MKTISVIAGALALAASGLTSVAARAQEAPKFFFEGDMVRSAQGERKGPPCVLNNQFHRGEIVIFRVRLLDAKTGKPVDASGVKSMEAQLSNGDKAPISYKRHPPPPAAIEDNYWTGGWIVGDKQPTGSLTYKIVVTDLDGKTYTWSPFAISTTQLTIVD